MHCPGGKSPKPPPTLSECDWKLDKRQRMFDGAEQSSLYRRHDRTEWQRQQSAEISQFYFYLIASGMLRARAHYD